LPPFYYIKKGLIENATTASLEAGNLTARKPTKKVNKWGKKGITV
jgi:hypothetical protein